MRVKVDGHCETAKVLRGYLLKSDFVSLVSNWPDVTVWVEEDSKLHDVIVDGVDGDLERSVINGIADSSKFHIRLQRVGGVQSDKEIRVIVPESNPGIEIGLANGVLKYIHKPKRKLF